MVSPYRYIESIKSNKYFLYLTVGAVNTTFAYFLSVALYVILNQFVHIVFISILCNVLCVTFSFVTYKLIVFKTKRNWIPEYIRCWTVYGGVSIFNIVGVWVMVDFCKISFWLATFILMAITVVLSYLGHSRYSFRMKNST